MTVRPIDANIAMKKIREYMEDIPNASTRLATCRSIISMLGDENQIPTLTPPNEWISVDERLPDEELNQIKRLFPGENEVEVLVMIEGAYIATTLYWDGEKFYDETSTYEVTHWMPLPAPPKKEHDHE